MQFSENDHRKSPRKHAEFQVNIFSSFSDRCWDAILCIFLHTCDSSVMLDGRIYSRLKSLRIIIRSVPLKIEIPDFQEMLKLHSVYWKEHLTVRYGWSGNAMKMSKIHSFLCNRLILAFCFALWVSSRTAIMMNWHGMTQNTQTGVYICHCSISSATVRWPCVLVYCSGVVRIDPLRFLAGCRTRRLNQA